MLLCLSGTILSGQSQNSARDIVSYLETSSETPELETTAIHPSGIDSGETLVDSHVSGAAFPAGKLFLSFKCCLFISMLLANTCFNT